MSEINLPTMGLSGTQTPPLSSGAFSLMGSLAGTAYNAWSQNNANKLNIQLARENREWSEYMSNTAHQRQVRDLRAAGLNPMLSANAGASAPTSAPAQTSAPQVDTGLFDKSYGRHLQRAEMEMGFIERRQQIINAEADEKIKLAQVENLRAQTAKENDSLVTAEIYRALMQAQTSSTEVSAKKLSQDILESVSRVLGINEQIEASKQGRELRQQSIIQNRDKTNIYDKFGKYLVPAEMSLEGVGKILQLGTNAKRLIGR